MTQVATDSGALVRVEAGIETTNDTGTTINGTGVDRMNPNSREGQLSCKFFARIGTEAGGTVTTWDVKIQDSPDNSVWADFTDESGNGAMTQITADNSEGEVSVNLLSADRYVRLVSTLALSAGTAPISAVIVFGGSQLKPGAL
jgi:hypothetical protein